MEDLLTIYEISVGGGTIERLTAKTKSDAIRIAGSIVGTRIKSAAIVRGDQGTLIAAIGWRESLRRYSERGPTGFLHARCEHVVEVVGFKIVYCGNNARQANLAYRRWRKFAGGTEGRAAGKFIHHTKDGRTVQTYLP